MVGAAAAAVKTKRPGRCFRSGVRLGALALSAAAGLAHAQGSEVEVVHQWTSQGEAYAVQSLKDALTKRGFAWRDSAIAGNDGANQQQALQARLAAGNAPTAAQAQPRLMMSYQEQDELASLDSYAKAGQWDAVLSPELRGYAKVKGVYYSLPLTEHRENMLWINAKLLARYGGKAPATWDEFNALAQRMQKDGVLPLALGGEDWQEAEVFSAILIGIGGADFYRKVFVQRDPAAIQSDTMVKVFDEFRKVLGFTDPNRIGRDWNAATQMVIDGKAAMQIHADWAKGEFLRAHQQPGVDFVCSVAPGNGRAFVFVTDGLVFFRQTSAAGSAGQRALVNAAADPAVQETFNLRKGSLPARIDVPQDRFDSCARMNFADRSADQQNGLMLPSFVENVADDLDVRGAFVDVITEFANSPSLSSQSAIHKIVRGLRNL